jgi:acetyl-CoA acetyltransferase
MLNATNSKVAVIGVGHSSVHRRDDVPLVGLAMDACRMAIADAGLAAADIDGIMSLPTSGHGGSADIDGVEGVSPELLQRAFSMDTAWMERSTRVIVHGFIAAAHAVASGTCKAVLVARAIHSPRGKYGHVQRDSAAGDGQFKAPYGIDGVAPFALLAQRYLERYGGSREDLGAFAVQNRANGLLWEYGYWAQKGAEPLTIDEYMAGRMISSPLSLYDCDIPVQGCGAFVLTSAERAADCVARPAYILGMANDMSYPHNFLELGMEGAVMRAGQLAQHLWKNSRITPADLAVANLYDGFSIFTPLWMEALGLCGEGEALARIAAGETALEGRMPINTSGGNQGAGRMHGITHIMESVLQVMGRAGKRQVPGARLSLAVVGALASSGGVVFSDRLEYAR